MFSIIRADLEFLFSVSANASAAFQHVYSLSLSSVFSIVSSSGSSSENSLAVQQQPTKGQITHCILVWNIRTFILLSDFPVYLRD